jgi:ribosomal-protein-alanine N-acetyltransferase
MTLTLHAGGALDVEELMVTMEEAFDPAFGEAWNRAQCLGLLSLPDVWLTLARQDGEPAGFALARVVLDEAELLLLGVRPKMRRAGIGAALLRHTIMESCNKDAKRLHLEVRQGNPALYLYENAGFTEIGRRRGYYRGNEGQLFDALTLATVLSGKNNC